MIKQSIPTTTASDWAPTVLAAGNLASTLSSAALMWRGRREAGSAVAPINAVSHWFWPRSALQRDDASVKHTATGAAVLYLSSMLLGSVYALVRDRRRRPGAVNAVTDAAAVTALAAVINLSWCRIG